MPGVIALDQSFCHMQTHGTIFCDGMKQIVWTGSSFDKSIKIISVSFKRFCF